MSGTLYLVATPIGNLGDLSPRGVQTLQEADFIAAEDTRVSMKLLNHFDIKKPLVSYHEHNRAAAGQAILARLLAGETCALVTDAGTPAISDPGEDLVRLCGENGVTVQAIPGCCAAVCALAVSGLPTGRFTFEGFLSANKRERREALTRLAAEQRTMVVVTDEMSFARGAANRILYVNGGLIAEEGTPEEIFGAPKTAELRAFLGSGFED